MASSKSDSLIAFRSALSPRLFYLILNLPSNRLWSWTFQPLTSGLLLSFLSSFDERVPKLWPTSYLQRRCKRQPIPSKNCCVSICASPLCASSLASYQSFCPTITLHPGVHLLFWRYIVGKQLPFKHVELCCSKRICTGEMQDLHWRNMRFALEKCEICNGKTRGEVEICTIEMWNLHWKNVRFGLEKCTAEMWDLNWRNVRFGLEKCEICAGEIWDLHWRNVRFALETVPRHE